MGTYNRCAKNLLKILNRLWKKWKMSGPLRGGFFLTHTVHRVTTHTTVIWIRTLTTAIHFILSSSSYNWVTSSAYILFKSCLAISLWRATNSVYLISYLLTKVTSANQLVRKAMAHVRMSGTHTTCPMLTLWRPLLPYGYSYKASCARPG